MIKIILPSQFEISGVKEDAEYIVSEYGLDGNACKLTFKSQDSEVFFVFLPQLVVDQLAKELNPFVTP